MIALTFPNGQNSDTSVVCIQPVQYVSGHVDNAVLERMGKIMSYLRVTAGKPNKKPKKKDKLAALHGMGSAGGTNFPIVHGTDNIMPKSAGQWVPAGYRIQAPFYLSKHTQPCRLSSMCIRTAPCLKRQAGFTTHACVNGLTG